MGQFIDVPDLAMGLPTNLPWRLPLVYFLHLRCMNIDLKSEIQLPVPNNRTPAEPMPPPIKEPPSPMENPDAPVREPDPEEPEQI